MLSCYVTVIAEIPGGINVAPERHRFLLTDQDNRSTFRQASKCRRRIRLQ